MIGWKYGAKTWHRQIYTQRMLVEKLLTRLKKTYKKLLSNVSGKYHKNMLQPKKPLETLNINHYEFAATPTDKANRNFTFICQWFSAFVLVKELGLNQNVTCINKT